MHLNSNGEPILNDSKGFCFHLGVWIENVFLIAPFSYDVLIIFFNERIQHCFP